MKSTTNIPAAALITMPFSPLEGPSIQLGILKACLKDQTITKEDGSSLTIKADDFYFNVDFFLEMKKNRYSALYNSTLPSLVSEWFFSPVPFPKKKSFLDINAFNRLEQFASASGTTLDKLLLLKEKIIPDFLDKIVDDIFWGQYSLLCFTLSYAQINASFELAKRVKKLFPHIKTLFGGAFSQVNEDSIQEFMKNYDFIDYFILGDAEPVFASLVKEILQNKEPSYMQLPGVFFRKEGKPCFTQKVSLLENLNESPVPDYSGYFKKYKELSSFNRIGLKRNIPVEMSRGCIWGQHSPCTFCAFYPCGTFRVKSADCICSEISRQYDDTGSASVYIVDAAVTASMIEDIFPRLQKIPDLGGKISIPFMEVRTTLKQEHVKLLKEAGVKLIQPGIESLESRLLKRLNKGVDLFSNLLFMKFCRQQGIRLSYNIILGIPDAQEDELENQLHIIERLFHLDPPYPMPLSIVKYSKYFKTPEKYNITHIQPDSFYNYIYPKEMDINKTAFEYQGALIKNNNHSHIYQKTISTINQWRKSWTEGKLPFLELKNKEGGIIINDGRKTPFKPAVYEFDGLKGEVYKLCMNKPRNPLSIAKKLLSMQAEAVNGKIKDTHPFPHKSNADTSHITNAYIEEIEQILQEFDEMKLMARWKGSGLSLALQLAF